MKKLLVCLVLIAVVCVSGCAQPMPLDISARISDGKLIIMYQSPKNERLYNKKAGIIILNEKETKYLKEILNNE